MSDKNLYQRIVDIMADMGAVGKGGKTDYGEKYAYHKIDDIDDKLRQALVAHGVVATIAEIEDRKLEHFDGTDKYGKPRTTWYAECKLHVELVNADTPGERLIIMGWGQGMDFSDKATGKAISYAAKAAYLSAFHLRGQPDSESDDIRRPAPPPPKLSAEDTRIVDNAKKGIEETVSLDELRAIGLAIKEHSPAIQNSLRNTYADRNLVLKQKEKTDAES